VRALLASIALVVAACRPGEGDDRTASVSRSAGSASSAVVDASPPVVDASVTDAASAASATRDTLALASARASGGPVSTAEDAAWFPLKVLEVIARSAHGLPAPSAPALREDVTVWTVALPAAETTLSLDARVAVCVEVQRALPAVACETDVAELRGIERARWVFAWRSDGPPPRANLATPLRALSRLGPGVCLRSAERTLRTLELSITANDMASLGEALALLTVAPRMAELVLIRAENRGTEIRADLSWPTDRADRTAGDLRSDPWPRRCGERAEVLAGDATALRALTALSGTPARGVIVERASRQFIVTVGDRVGDAEIESIDDARVRVRRAVRGRAQSISMPFQGAGTNPAREARPPLVLPPEPARGLP